MTAVAESKPMAPGIELGNAAQRIRKLAEAATVGPWKLLRLDAGRSGEIRLGEIEGPDGHTVASVDHCAGHQGRVEADAAYITMWHPVVASAVAELLEGMAEHWAARPIADWDIYWMSPLCRLARAINGGAS